MRTIARNPAGGGDVQVIKTQPGKGLRPVIQHAHRFPALAEYSFPVKTQPATPGNDISLFTEASPLAFLHALFNLTTERAS
ncbi:MAG: hypothetical protein RSE29_02910 [Leclercia sp.]